jgi:hypothetical protein
MARIGIPIEPLRRRAGSVPFRPPRQNGPNEVAVGPKNNDERTTVSDPDLDGYGPGLAGCYFRSVGGEAGREPGIRMGTLQRVTVTFA